MPLFERVAGRTVLSDAGRVMVPYAERAVAAAQDAENAVRALARPDSGPVALAVVGTLAGGQLSEIMKRFAARKHPDVNLSLRTATSAEVSDLIRRGEATIGLRYDRDPSRDLDCEVLFCRAASGRVRAGPSARRPPRQKTCRPARRTLDRFPRGAGTAARSRPRMCSRCSRTHGWATSRGRRSTA